MRKVAVLMVLLLSGWTVASASAAEPLESEPLESKPANQPASHPEVRREAEQAQSLPPIRNLAPMVVSGVQPGPGLWKVVGKEGHLMWVLGTVEPLPAGLQWQSARVERAIAQSDRLLLEPGLAVHWDIGFFSGLSLLPSALRIRRNPDGAELEDVLPADLYARWRVQKDKYIGWKWGLENWRPVFAADELYEAAMEDHGLDDEVITPAIAIAAEAAGLERTPVMLRTDVDDPRDLIKDFNRSAMDDVGCLERVLDRLEHGLPTVIERANAWATGDIAALRRLATENVEYSCLRSVLETDFARRHGFDDLEQQTRALWLETAEQALTDNEVTFALLPMGQVLADDGLLAELATRGYRVVAPEGDALAEPVDPDGLAPVGGASAPTPAVRSPASEYSGQG